MDVLKNSSFIIYNYSSSFQLFLSDIQFLMLYYHAQTQENRNFFMHNMSKNNKNKNFSISFCIYRFSPICHPAWLPNSELEKNIMGIVENILKSTKILYCYRTLFIVRTPRNLFETDKSMEKKKINRKKKSLIFWFLPIKRIFHYARVV